MVEPDQDLALCTIISKNYLSYARVLVDSFHQHHPTGRAFVLLVDRVDGRFPGGAERFELVELAALGIPDLTRMSFQYSILELNTAVKPHFMRHLLTRRGVSRLFYLDPDILVFRSLTELAALLAAHSILLVPHLTAPTDSDGKVPDERSILRAGVYNLGFLGVRKDPTVLAFLEWWGRHLGAECFADPDRGLFVDQRWIDLVPGLFGGAHIVRDPGYDVAYWNLTHRQVETTGGEVSVNGRPLQFFHFSGLDVDRLGEVSKHQNRYTLDDLPAVRPLFEAYRDRLLSAGYRETSEWSYAFGQFDNGVPIPGEARRAYSRLGEENRRFGNPFATQGSGSFWHWLTADAAPGTGVSRLWYHIHTEHPELQQAYPDPLGADRDGFLAWARESGCWQHRIPDRLSPPAPGVAAMGPERHHRPLGLNVAGYAMSEKGVGEALRATVRALTAAGIGYGVLDVPDPTSENVDRQLIGLLRHNPYGVNLIHLNADALPHFIRQAGSRFLRNRYNIGFWMWEVPEFPAAFHGAFIYLDEVWVPSSIALEAISRVSPIPVLKVPLALPAGGLPTLDVGRDHFGLPKDATVFLFMFDIHSIPERKNPLGLIAAFRRAFGGDERVRLVVKTSHGGRQTTEALVRAAGDPRVIVMDRILDRREINTLMALSDCYVSLHRSEGFGITMAEAMALGKPVIGTGHSANLDFMRPGNSLLVDCRLVRLERDHGPYLRGSTWAEPDLDHAAELMRLVYDDPDRVGAIAREGQRDVTHYLAPERIGREIAARLAAIAEQSGRARGRSPFSQASGRR
jgi:glycosyltransferase involved in cell wall biosynthesis